tara:strand:+ start:1512 stop:1835 length:324 start_codon:yes stop_codon:yes gene_type:complete
MFEDGMKFILLEYREVRKTDQGCWVARYHYSDKLKFVLDGSGKRFCHETKEMAWDSYKRRKEAQHRISKHQLNIATFALSKIKDMTEAPLKTINIGVPSFIDNYVFD